ncbi:MAG: hypothetical protein G8237_02125 [Magnetococcales bacterium]|nr:hypothetical protein [Magnetococcales bacterium]
MGQKISRMTMELLAELCEGATPRTGGEKMSDHFPREGAEAIRLGALRPGPLQTMVPDRSNHECHYVEAEWDAASRGFRYFSADARGWVPVPKEDMLTWDLDLEWLMGWIGEQFGLSMPLSPKLLIQDRLWHLGNPWIGKRRCALFFTRRLGFASGYDQVVDALQERSGEPAGVLLTTSLWTIRNARFPGNHRVMRLHDCFPPGEEHVRIDLDAIARVLSGTAVQERELPLRYSNDYSSITVSGRNFLFRGDKQKQVIGALINAWQRGEPRVRTQEVLEAIDSNATQITKLFHRHPDWKELIGYGDGYCWLLI